MSELTVAEKPVPCSAAQAQVRAQWGEQLLDALPIGICLCDREGMLIRYTPRSTVARANRPSATINAAVRQGRLRSFTRLRTVA